MKQLHSFSASGALLVFCLTFLHVSIFAQGDPGTDDDDFIVRIVSPASIARDIKNGFQNCGWVGAADFGPSVTSDICGELVWALPDSLACSPLPAGSLDGKFAFIRRGSCNFSLKIYNAQQAGAKAVIVANHYTNTLDEPCAAYIDANTYFGGMSGLDSASAVTIPAVFIQRQTAEAIDDALSAGETVEVCFTLPRVSSPYAGYHYATPVSQVTPLPNIGFNFNNREATPLEDVVVKADIHEPDGNVTTLEMTIPSIAPGVDTLLLFPAYTPPAITGEFTVVFSTSQYTEPRDTLTRKFVHTDYTWAADNLDLLLDGGAALNDEFATDLIYQVGSLVYTGENGGTARYSTFGIANIDSIYNPTNPAANLISVILYDADSDGNGDLNLISDFQGDLQSDVVGVGTYEMTGNETEASLIDVLLIDNNGDTGVALIPNHPYYTTILYDGNENGTGQMPAFTNTAYVDYLFYSNEAGSFVPTNPIMLGGTLSYWSDRTIVNRLQLEGYVSSIKQTGKVLDKTKYSVTPNPAGDVVQVNLELTGSSEWVNVAIMSPGGKLIRSKNLSHFQSGRIDLPARDLPGGPYLLWIRTPEGQAVTKVAIVH